MIIAFKIDERAKKQLDMILESGSYRDYSDVIASAINNLALLHEEMGEGRSLVLDEPQRSATRLAGGPGQPELQLPQSGNRSSTPVLVGSYLLHRAALESANRPNGFAPMPEDFFVPGEQVPIDRWLFGQYSKLLPAKASVRALANLEVRDDGLDLESTASVIAGHAAALGQYLADVDRRHHLQRDDALALGFPSSAEKSEKSRLRYANQFVGSLNKRGVLSGLLVDLKLVNLMDTRTPWIQLTKPGWDF